MKKIVVAFALLTVLAWNLPAGAKTLEEFLPSGGASAAIVEIGTVLNSPLYAKAAARLPKLEETGKFFEEQFPVPRRNCRRLILFGTPENEPGGLLEVADFPESLLAKQMENASYQLKKQVLDVRAFYLLTIADQYGGGSSVALTYLAENVILLAENVETIGNILALAPIGAEERRILLAGHDPNHIFFAASNPEALNGQASGTGLPPFARITGGARKMTAGLQFQGDNRGGLLFQLEMPFDTAELANQFLMAMNMLVFMSVGALSSDHPELARDLMQGVKLQTRENRFDGKISFSEETVDALLELLSKDIDPYLVTPQEARKTGDTSSFRKTRKTKPAPPPVRPPAGQE